MNGAKIARFLRHCSQMNFTKVAIFATLFKMERKWLEGPLLPVLDPTGGLVIEKSGMQAAFTTATTGYLEATSAWADIVFPQFGRTFSTEGPPPACCDTNNGIV